MSNQNLSRIPKVGDIVEYIGHRNKVIGQGPIVIINADGSMQVQRNDEPFSNLTWETHLDKENDYDSYDGWKWPDADKVENEIEVTPKGGKHSKLEVALDLLPPEAITRVGKVLYHGAKRYGVDNWRGISRRDNLRHALAHIYNVLGNKELTEDELAHAAARVLFAMETNDDV